MIEENVDINVKTTDREIALYKVVINGHKAIV